MEEKKIYKAIANIMGEIGHIGKDKKNQQQGFMFRGIDQVMNTMKPLLAKHGVFIVPEVMEMQREERTTARGGNLIYSVLTVKHHFIADDGSEVVSTTIGEGMDSADKASNKAMAIAFKYACFQVFCIPTEEMAQDDPDNYVPENSTKKQSKQQDQPEQPAQPKEPASKKLTEETAKKLALNEAQGKLTKDGRTARQYFMDEYNPNQAQVTWFDNAVASLKQGIEMSNNNNQAA